MTIDSILADYADFATQLKDDLGRKDLAFLRRLVEALPSDSPLFESAAHVYHAARAGVVKAQGTERAGWSWAFAGVALVSHDGEELQSWPKSEDGNSKLCRPRDLFAALAAANQMAVLVWLD